MLALANAMYRDYEAGLTSLLLGLFPRYTASRAYKARLKIAAAMLAYFRRQGQDKASGLLRVRYEVGKKNGMSLQGIATSELGDCVGVLINATPTTFWLLWHIYSSPSLLVELRDEVQGILGEASDGVRELILDTSKFKSHCPLLFSTYQEVLRVQTHNSSSRWILADTMLQGRYLLKAGNPLQMPGGVIHAEASLWGPDYKNFNPRRFTKAKDIVGQKVKPGSFRAFGGGATLCPGRHFATTEILSVVAMMIMRFDISPSGMMEWIDPGYARGRVASSIPPPAQDVKVTVSHRRGYQDRQWDFGGIGGGHAGTASFEVT